MTSDTLCVASIHRLSEEATSDPPASRGRVFFLQKATKRSSFCAVTPSRSEFRCARRPNANEVLPFLRLFLSREPPGNPLIGFSPGKGGDKRGPARLRLIWVSICIGRCHGDGNWISHPSSSSPRLGALLQESDKLSLNFTNCFPATRVVNHRVSRY